MDKIDYNDNNTFTYSNNEIHYYGTCMNITNDNDVSLLTRGSVWYLRDNEPSNNRIKQHPYIVLQKSYIDKDGMITVFGVTSSPTYINMIPIIVKDSITYINPYKPHMHHISEFNVKSYIGTIVNPVVLDLLGDMYGMSLGLNLYRTEKEIIDAYINYVDEFNIRAKKYMRYNSKLTPISNSMYKNELELKISFSNIYMDDDISDDINTFDNVFDEDTAIEEAYTFSEPITESIIEEPYVVPEEPVEEPYVVLEEPVEEPYAVLEVPIEENPVSIESKPKKTRNTGESKKKNVKTAYVATKQYLKIDMNDHALLDSISIMESEPAGKVTLSIFNRMNDFDVAIFMLYVKLHGSKQTSLLYNCSEQTITYRRRQVEKFYNIEYTN